MYCNKCRRRESCTEICPKLEAHLRSREKYQRETNLDPRGLALVERKVGLSWPGLLPDYPWLWEKLRPFLADLPAPMLHVFILHFYDGDSVGEIGRSLGIHHGTVIRRLERAVLLIKQAMAEAAKREKEEQSEDD